VKGHVAGVGVDHDASRRVATTVGDRSNAAGVDADRPVVVLVDALVGVTVENVVVVTTADQRVNDWLARAVIDRNRRAAE
jgi:hypothetical protein